MTSWKALTVLATIIPHATFADKPNMSKPKQGVFLLSNQQENEIGVYESLDDGRLSWVDTYKTGGIGYPEHESADNLNSLGSTNSVAYHVWDDSQWLVVSNAGGPEGDATITLMEVNPTTLDLTVQSTVPLEGIFTCSVHAFKDRVCAVTCAGSVTMECFRIQPGDDNSYTMVPEFMHDFGANIPDPVDRPMSTSSGFGPGNILFSGDGLQVGIIMKGDALLSEEHRLLGYSAPKAGFYSFPVLEEGYGDPAFLALPDSALPFGFEWKAGDENTKKQIVLVVNIAGEFRDFPACAPGSGCRSSVTSLMADIKPDFTESLIAPKNTVVLSKVDEIIANQVDLCWIDFRFSHFYTGNLRSDSVTIGQVSSDGTLTLERNVPIGRGTIPNDIAHMGRKIDGHFYLYTENQGSAEVGVHKVIENDSFQLQIMAGAPYPDGVTGDAWIGSHGIATTLLSEEELFAMYNYKIEEDNTAEDEGAIVEDGSTRKLLRSVRRS